MSNAIDDVIRERRRQIEREGFNTEHDDKYCGGELSKAAAGYADHAADVLANGEHRANWDVPCDWPWEDQWWKPTSPRRDLVKAAALVIAEIERLDRENIARTEEQERAKA